MTTFWWATTNNNHAILVTKKMNLTPFCRILVLHSCLPTLQAPGSMFSLGYTWFPNRAPLISYRHFHSTLERCLPAPRLQVAIQTVSCIQKRKEYFSGRSRAIQSRVGKSIRMFRYIERAPSLSKDRRRSDATACRTQRKNPNECGSMDWWKSGSSNATSSSPNISQAKMGIKCYERYKG